MVICTTAGLVPLVGFPSLIAVCVREYVRVCVSKCGGELHDSLSPTTMK